jgi:PAS domain S-box-containing protein
MNSSSRIRFFAANLALAAVYFGCGKFGLSLAFLNASASPVWPPTGVSLAALLLWGPRLWPGVFLGALLVNLTTQGTPLTSLWIAAGNTLEALAGAWLVGRFAGGVKAFERTSTFFRYALHAGVISTMLSPALGVTALCVRGLAHWDQFGTVWLTWWLGDMVSNLLLAPLLVIWVRQGWPRLTTERTFEAAGLIVTVVVMGQLVFLILHGYPLLYLTIPPLLWAGFRFGERGAVTATLLMAGIALWGTLHGRGPFTNPDPNESLLLLQAFVGTISLTGLALALAVSERKQAQQTLRESEARLRLQAVALESAANAILIADRHGLIQWVNGAFTRLTGYSAGEALGQNPRFLKSDRHPPDFYQDMWNTVLAGRVWHGEVVNKRKDGSLYTEEMTITPVMDSAGADSHFIAIKQDVTERRTAEKALREAKDELAGANARLEELVSERTAKLQEMVSELEHFSYSIVHDMRAPLRGIQGFAELILEESGHELSPGAKQHLARIRKSANRMDQLITDSLSYSKAVRTDLPVRPVDVGVLLHGIIESYPEFAEADVELEGEFPKVIGNEAGLTQCFSNLLHNAVKFVRPGQPARVRIRAEQRLSLVRVVVSDNGVGIPQAGLQKIFGMFQRMHGAEYQGTGIGLALVRKVMDRMGGRVGVTSEMGRGSHFWLELPAAEAKPSETGTLAVADPCRTSGGVFP